MDAKLTMSLSACRGESPAGVDSNWTEYMKAFNGKMYRPDVAPADMESDDSDDSDPATLITNPLFESAGKKR